MPGGRENFGRNPWVRGGLAALLAFVAYRVVVVVWGDRFPPRESSGGRLVVVTVDHKIRSFAFNTNSTTGPDELVEEIVQESHEITKSGGEFNRISVSPNEDLAVIRFAVQSRNEHYIKLYDLRSPAILFTAYSWSSPSSTINITDSFVPEPLLAEQRRLDVTWEKDKSVDPNSTRTIASAVFGSNPNGASVEATGWATDGQLVVRGARPLRITLSINGRETSSFEDDVPVPWWGLVGLIPGTTQWGFTTHQVGVLPASVPVQPVPSRKRAVTLGTPDPTTGLSPLLVDGVVQTAAGLASGVLGFDGPFIPQLSLSRNPVRWITFYLWGILR